MFDDSSSPLSRPTALETPEEGTAQSAAVQRYHSCRWRKPPEEGSPLDFCSHRDVLPMAGTNGFDPEAWCPDCEFYKVRRVPKKRPTEDFGY